MIQTLVDEIRKAMDNDLLLVALSAALTLPDVCGKVAFPDEQSSRVRYVNWFEDEIGQYEKSPHHDGVEMPYVSGKVLYSLRCSFLHSGNPNIDNSQLERNHELPIDHFSLKREKKNQFNIYGDMREVSTNGLKTERSYTMSIRRICMIICDVAEAYYLENKERFHFDCDVIDWEKITSHLPEPNMDEIHDYWARDTKGRKDTKEV